MMLTMYGRRPNALPLLASHPLICRILASRFGFTDRHWLRPYLCQENHQSYQGADVSITKGY